MTRIRVAAVIGLLLGLAALAALLRLLPTATYQAASTDPATSTTPLSPSASVRQAAFGRSANKTGVPAVTESARTALLGSVVAPTQATLSVRMPARIRQVFVREGETVRTGQPMIDLDETEFAGQEQTARAGEAAARAQVEKARAGLSGQQVKAGADVDTARGGLRQAQTRLQQAELASQAAADEQQSDLRAAREGVRKAQVALDRAQDTLRGLEELARVGGVSRSDLEGARAQQRVAQSDLDSARAQVDRIQAGSGGLPYRVAVAQKDEDVAQSSVQQARDGLKAAEEGRRQLIKIAEQDVHVALAASAQAAAGLAGVLAARKFARLQSPIDGVVTSVGARRGETAQPGAALATIVSLAGLRVEALVPARLLTLFRAGQPAGISVDTAPNRVFNAVVGEIARIAEPDGRTFRVKFRLVGKPPLLPGQSARISVFTGQR